MSAAGKGFHFRRLKAAGVPLDRHFRDYTTAELKEADDMAIESGLLQPPTPEELEELEAKVHKKKPRTEPTPIEAPPADPEAADFFGFDLPAENSNRVVRKSLRPDYATGNHSPSSR